MYVEINAGTIKYHSEHRFSFFSYFSISFKMYKDMSKPCSRLCISRCEAMKRCGPDRHKNASWECVRLFPRIFVFRHFTFYSHSLYVLWALALIYDVVKCVFLKIAWRQNRRKIYVIFQMTKESEGVRNAFRSFKERSKKNFEHRQMTNVEMRKYEVLKKLDKQRNHRENNKNKDTWNEM